MPDLKKLISIFLLLAGVGGSFALVFSIPGAPAPDAASLSAATTGPAKPTSLPRNAFVESVPDNTVSQKTPPQTDLLTSRNSKNLTAQLTNQFAQEFFDNNPNGPLTDNSGAQNINLPSEDHLAGIIKQAATGAPVEFVKKISDADISIAPHANRDDSIAYLDTVNAAVAENVANQNFQKLTLQDPSPQMISAIQVAFEMTTNRLQKISVPQPFVPFHKTLLAFFSDQKSIFEAIGDYATDPAKAALAMDSGDAVLNHDLQNLQKELRATDFQKIIAETKAGNRWDSLFADIIGIRSAHAFWPTFDAANFGQWIHKVLKEIKNWIYDTLLSQIVNHILNQLQNQVVGWINGGGTGKPKFITDWKGFLADAGSNAAGAAISGIAPGLCSGFSPLLQVALTPIPNEFDSTRCTLGDIEKNINAFYNDFQTGGWVAYGASLQPQNNFFGSLIIDSDIVTLRAEAAREAAKNEALAGKGFLDVKTCPGTTSGYKTKPDSLGRCPGGETPITETPGTSVGDSLSHALNWKPNRIINAKRIGEVVGAILDAAINKLTSSAKSALSSIKSSDPDHSSSYSNDAFGAGASAEFQIPTDIPNLVDTTDTRSSLSESADTQTGSLHNSIATLGQIVADCPALKGQAEGLKAQAEKLLAQVGNIKSQIQGAPDIAALDALNSDLSKVGEDVSNVTSATSDLAAQCPAVASPTPQ